MGSSRQISSRGLHTRSTVGKRLGTWRRRALLAGVVLVSVVTGLALTEGMLRLAGRTPWRQSPRKDLSIVEPDPVLGWRPIPGWHTLGPYSPGAPPVHITINADGSRDTGSPPEEGRPELLLLGCSFTMGWAVSDEETFAWGLQQRRPDLRVVNHGVEGYSTYQALLLLERLLDQGERPAHVVYGYVLTHENRNVADPQWLRILARYSFRGIVEIPWCSLAPDGRLLRHPPAGYPVWPLRESLAIVAMLEDAYVSLRDRDRAAQGVDVTEQLLLEMAERCRARDIRFSVLILSHGLLKASAYIPFLRARDIDVIDCHILVTPDLAVPGEGHPNALAHAQWSECLAAALPPP